jgi:hypothetical protein
MGVVDPRGGADAFFKAVLGAGAGRPGEVLQDQGQTEAMPQAEPAGVACPRCGAPLRVLPGRLASKVPTRMVGCASCGFIGLQPHPAG